ncbi:hypothetical protein [Nocardioides sp. Iso805N]|uniref:hypothetical protein n=1 Tax=Nocardioides sp. Iso805N TaxID=1283287 RepID=UPI00037F3C23|nr:hypothetical protein [Nocardioides sp. Iso805N]
MRANPWLGVGALAITLGAGLMAVPSAEALPVSVPARIVTSGCSAALGYREGIGDGKVPDLYPGYKGHGAGGTVTYCTYKYRLSDKDTSADYYISEVRMSFKVTQKADAGLEGRDGTWAVRVASSLPAKSRVYNATPTYRKTVLSGCPSVSVGYSFFGVGPSISLGQVLCASTTVTRASLTTTGAAWRSAHASDMRLVDLAFSEKVANKKVPKFTFNATRPAYTYKWAAVKQQTHGYAYTGYKPTATRTLLGYAVTR